MSPKVRSGMRFVFVNAQGEYLVKHVCLESRPPSTSKDVYEATMFDTGTQKNIPEGFLPQPLYFITSHERRLLSSPDFPKPAKEETA